MCNAGNFESRHASHRHILLKRERLRVVLPRGVCQLRSSCLRGKIIRTSAPAAQKCHKYSFECVRTLLLAKLPKDHVEFGKDIQGI